MAKFLIEVPHESDKLACAKAIKVFLSTGSHFLTNAHWGCPDGAHKAWIIVDIESKEQARSILPSAFRSQAKIVRLEKFTMEDVNDVLLPHHD